MRRLGCLVAILSPHPAATVCGMGVNRWRAKRCTRRGHPALPGSEGPLQQQHVSPPASAPAGTAADPPAEELPGLHGGRWHPRVLRRPPASVPGTVLPGVGHLPYVCAGAPQHTEVHHRYRERGAGQGGLGPWAAWRGSQDLTGIWEVCFGACTVQRARRQAGHDVEDGSLPGPEGWTASNLAQPPALGRGPSGRLTEALPRPSVCGPGAPLLGAEAHLPFPESVSSREQSVPRPA